MRERRSEYSLKRPLVVCLYGPPGSGKSTTIRVMRELVAQAGTASVALAVLAFDLESLPDRGRRLKLVSQLTDPRGMRVSTSREPYDVVICGMADVAPNDVLRIADLSQVAVLNIALLPDLLRVSAQGIARNSDQPWKAGQSALSTLGGFITHVDLFDLVVTGPPLAFLRDLLALRPSTTALSALIADFLASTPADERMTRNAN